MQLTTKADSSGCPATAMKAGGFYNRHSQLQRTLIHRSLALLEQAAASAPFPSAPGGTFRIADLGCSQGGNSVVPVATVLRVLQSRARAGVSYDAGGSAIGGSGLGSRAPALHVEVMHEDLPENDWRSLFGVVYGEGSYIPRPGECTDLEVFATAVGRSMYDRLFPTASVQLAMAFTCLHWQPSIPNRRPTDTMQPYATADKEVYEAFRKSANDHLRTFLALRAVEVVPGGSLVCNIPTHTAGRDQLGLLYRSCDAAVQQMVSEGLLSPGDAAQLTVPVFFYQPADILDMLLEGAGELSSAWAVRAAEEARVHHPAYERYRVGQIGRAEMVREIVDGLRAAGEPHAVRALSVRHGAVAAEGLACQIFGRMERLLSEQLPLPDGGGGDGGASGAGMEAAEAPRGTNHLNLWLQRK